MTAPGQADEYTPTEEQLRDQLEDVWLPKIDGKHNSEGWLDRFLADRDRAVREAAWDEGYQHAYVVGAQEGATGVVVEYTAPNPYRKGAN